MGKELWMTEHMDTLTTWQANLGTGKEIHDAMAEANFRAYLWWYIKRFYGPLRENGAISKRGYVMAQYSKFVRPGAHRVAVTGASSPDDVYVSAYDGEDAAIVALNLGSDPVTLRPQLQDRDISGVTPVRTQADSNLVEHETVPVSDGRFTHTLPPESITTFAAP